MKKKRIALIDGDELLYKTGFGCVNSSYRVFNGNAEIINFKFPEKKLAKEYFEGDNLLLVQESITLSENAHIEKLELELKKLLNETGATDYKIYLNDPDYNFRNDIATILPYKGNRETDARPIYHQFLKDYMLDQLNTEVWEGAEADDGLSFNQLERGTIICSQDKDLNMVPGWRRFYNGEIRYIHPREAVKSFYTQLLTGDSTDNIPGLYNVGMLKANKILANCKNIKQYFKAVLIEYETFMRNPHPKSPLVNTTKTAKEVVLEIGQLLWMQRPHKLIWEFPY